MNGTPERGRIITFYSYKGGTGRSMAVANIAWILASHGKRVLAIDWDLEAPGLHRYFHPFLADPELTSSPGLIDFFVDFSIAARAAENPSGGAEPWWQPWTSLLRYTHPLDWEFGPSDPTQTGEATLDLVPAGQQGPEYGERVASFNWQEFYSKLGGGVFLEALKQRLRERYDYVLIDSRTGISDTAGVCTVQMPDDLVVCFTLNQQSIKGAAAVAESADSQRRKPSGEPGLRIWPVPTRIELAEKDRLESARDLCRQTFQRYVGRLTRSDRAAYWGNVEVLYQPYYAYEEVLAVFADRRHHTSSMLSAMEAIAGWITGKAVTELADMPEEKRLEALGRFVPSRSITDTATVYVSSSWKDEGALFLNMLEYLRSQNLLVHESALPPMLKQPELYRKELLESSDVVLIAIGPRGLDKLQNEDVTYAHTLGKPLIPVIFPNAKLDKFPLLLARYQATVLDSASAGEFASLVQAIRQAPRSSIDPEDPQKGRWGGQASRNGRELVAAVREITPEWFKVHLEVRTTEGTPLAGEVVFHVHPSFPSSVIVAQAKDGRAELRLGAWGAFTVGAVADQGRTLLELDLAQDPAFPQLFRDR